MKTLRNSLLVTLLLTLIVNAFVFTSCNKKFIPVKDVYKDSTVSNTTTVYKSDTVMIPGENISFSKKIDRKKKFNSTIKKKNLSLNISLSNDSLFVNCKSDSLQHIVDSLAQTLTREKSFHNETKTIIQPQKEIKYRVPGWCYILIILILLYLTLKIYFKLPF